MITLISKWVVPITSKPIKNGAVVIDRSEIIDFGLADKIFKKYQSIRKDLGNAILMPALANAHTHLEFSFMRGKIKKTLGFSDWVRILVDEKEQAVGKELLTQAEQAIQQMHQSGISLIGEISNSLATMKLLAKSPLKGIIFHEIFGLKKESSLRHFAQALQGRQEFQKIFKKIKKFHFSISPHAPQTVSPTLFEMIRRLQNKDGFIVSVHLAESHDEVELMEKGRGQLKKYLKERNFWDPEWKTPGRSPVAYLDSLDFLSKNVRAVHCVQVSDQDIKILKRRNVMVITCPRSNKRLHTGKPPLKKFLKAGLKVALGTDSLASNDDLSIFNEMKFVKEEYPGIKSQEILRMATIHGAQALGLEKLHGSIDKGKTPDLICIHLDGRKGVKSPESILTSGVHPERISRPVPQ